MNPPMAGVGGWRGRRWKWPRGSEFIDEFRRRLGRRGGGNLSDIARTCCGVRPEDFAGLLRESR